jgi:hypothetical protein
VRFWLEQVADLAVTIAAAIARFFWPQTFLAFKVRLFMLWTGVLVGKAALNFDLEFTRSLAGSSLTVRIGGLDTAAIASTTVTLGVLTLANVFIALRRNRLSRELMDFARDPGVSDSLKREVIERLLDERNRRY